MLLDSRKVLTYSWDNIVFVNLQLVINLWLTKQFPNGFFEFRTHIKQALATRIWDNNLVFTKPFAVVTKKKSDNVVLDNEVTNNVKKTFASLSSNTDEKEKEKKPAIAKLFALYANAKTK